jgi:hypothetical protein
MALEVPKHVIHDLLDGASCHFAPTLWAVRLPNTGPQKTKVILDLRDRRHRGTRVVGALFLVDGDGRRKALNPIAIGFLHLADELACVGGKRFHVPSLTFRIEGIKGQGGLP